MKAKLSLEEDAMMKGTHVYQEEGSYNEEEGPSGSKGGVLN